MRRPLRILTSAATMLSLALCVVTMTAWVRSYLVRDAAWWALSGPRLLGISTHRGGLFAGVVAPPYDIDLVPFPGVGSDESAPVSYNDVGGPRATVLNRLGFALEHHWYRNEQRYLACPYWFILLLTAILPFAQFTGRRRARRLRMSPGLCQHCGYDCRATPDRCPECGKVPAAAPIHAAQAKSGRQVGLRLDSTELIQVRHEERAQKSVLIPAEPGLR